MTARQPGSTRAFRGPRPIFLDKELGVLARECRDCKIVKPTTSFYKASNKSGVDYRCKDCSHAWHRDYMARNQHKRRIYNHATRGCVVTQEWIDARLEEQGGLCAICRSAPATDIDHNHKTNKPRAMLCNGCNTGIARFHEDPVLMRAAADYIEEQKCLTT